MTTSDLTLFNPLLSFIWHLNLAIVGMIEDCNCGYIMIYDFQNYTLGHATKITPSMIRRAMHVYKVSFENNLTIFDFFFNLRKL